MGRSAIFHGATDTVLDVLIDLNEKGREAHTDTIVSGNNPDGSLKFSSVTVHPGQSSDDPEVHANFSRDNGTAIKNTFGPLTSPTLRSTGSQSTTLGGEAYTFFNMRHVFEIGAEQRLVVGGFARYDSTATTYDTGLSPVGSGVLVNAYGHSDKFTLGTFVGYRDHDSYISAVIGGGIGSGSVSDPNFASQGSYAQDSITVGAIAGHVFPLSMTQAYSLNLDVSGKIAYYSDWTGAFTDNTGFAFGTSWLHYVDLGPRATLYAVVPDGRFLWKPFVTATFDQRVDYSNTQVVPTQAVQTNSAGTRGGLGDTFSYSDGRTFYGVQGGLEVRDVSGILVGVRGDYQRSSTASNTGVRAYIRLPIVKWIEESAPIFAAR
jgi:hypothetical protein